MLAYARQAKEAESTYNVLKFQHRQLELEIEQLDEQKKLEYAAWVIAHAPTPEAEKALSSSSTVALKRNAIEAQIITAYPFVFTFDIPAMKLDLATKELQYRAARTDASYCRMIFLGALRGFNDTEEVHYDAEGVLNDTDLLVTDEINRQFEAAEQAEFTVDHAELLRERVAHDELLEALAAGYEQESISDIINA